MAAGVIFTFLPLAAMHASGNVIAAALLIQAAAATTSRWIAGHVGDKHGHGALLVPLNSRVVSTASMVRSAFPTRHL